MIYTYIFTPRALVQLKDAYEWYAKQSEITGEHFRTAVREQVEQICLNPTLYRNTRKNFREKSLLKFPFSIVFVIDKKAHVVAVTSVFHHRRNPKGKYPA